MATVVAMSPGGFVKPIGASSFRDKQCGQYDGEKNLYRSASDSGSAF